MALMMKEDLEEEGKTLNGVPEMPLGVTSPLVKEVAKLPLRWLAMVEGAVAILVNSSPSVWNLCLPPQLWPNQMVIAEPDLLVINMWFSQRYFHTLVSLLLAHMWLDRFFTYPQYLGLDIVFIFRTLNLYFLYMFLKIEYYFDL